MTRFETALVVAALSLVATPALAQQHHGQDAHGSHAAHAAAPAADTTAIAAIADALTRAIVAGDRAAVERILLPEAKIHEGGKVETRTEYFGHHFAADGAFLKALTREPLTRSVEIDGHTARVTSTSRVHGTYRERSLDLISTEVLVLHHATDGGWRVAEVHWSSEPRG